jgi:arsenate reductase (glutaredoxin)
MARSARADLRLHDDKTVGIDEALLWAWAAQLGRERLLNRAGTTFRKLPDVDKQEMTEGRAVALMLAQPSVLERPVLDLGSQRSVGFDERLWAEAVPR